jgi:protein involved in polysaccharide export with SLBB domain
VGRSGRAGIPVVSTGAARLLAGLLLLGVHGAAAAADEPRAAQEVAPPAASPAPIPEYVLQPGDQIEIRVQNIQELENTVTIRPDGRISLLLLDAVQASGLTPSQLDESLTALYATHYKDPKLTVIVRGFANLKVYVGGEVKQPSMVPLQGQLTAVAAIFAAGGFLNTARTDSVILIRNSGNGGAVLRKLDLKAVLTKGQPDLMLQPFDILYAPKSTIAKIDQFVDQYIKQVLPLTLTGGFTYLFGQSVVVAP